MVLWSISEWTGLSLGSAAPWIFGKIINIKCKIALVENDNANKG
jgi:hypothetical protein